VGAANGLVQITNGVARYVKKADGPSGFISVILSDRAGTLWVGTYSGLSRFVDGRFRDEGESDALAYRVYAMYEDREQNLWVGSEEGLARLTPKVFQTLTKKDGLTLNTVATVCAAPDGGVWISAWGGGLNHWVEGKFSFINKSNGLSSNFIMAMCAGRDGSLWAGADYGAALNWIKDGKIEIFDKDRGFITSPRTATTALYESPQGVLWVGSREMLQRWDGTNFHAFTTADGLSHAKINAICGGFGETVWIGTDGGLTRLQEGKFENLGLADPRLRTSILSLYEDEDRVLWIGTQRQGLLRLQADVVNEFTSRQGLLSDAIYSILEDANTNLWLNSSRGIFRVDKGQVADVLRGRRESIHSVTYSRVDGVLSSGQYRDVTQPSACKDADGRLWFRTTQGVAVVNPDQIKHNNQIPPVLIQSVMADKQPVGVTPLDLEIPPEIRIPPGRGELEIQYTALSLRAPEKNQFQYKLEGADLNWVDSGTRRVAFYNNLKPGRYRFQVVGCNNDGTWNEVGTSVFLILAPHFWQTRWFMAGVILASAAAVGGAARYVTRRRMQRKLVLLEQERAVEQERARIARDMHDELGAKLTRISFQGAMARQSASIPPETEKHIAKMAETARELVLSLDQIVWAVDPENDSLESLANYICRHASDFFENSPIQCKFSIPRELPACHLSTEVRHHIFLAVKEALNNALKHSGAKRVVLSISTSAGKLEISIADDGCGIADAKEPDKARRAGHGLINLRKRLASIHGQFELKNGPGRGTEVRFVVPLAEGTHTFI
jgi:signal transduction histidine kinase